MPSIVLNNTVQVRVTWNLSGVPFAVNVLHGIRDDPISAIDAAKAQNLADALVTRFTGMSAGAKSAMNSNVTLGSVGLRDLNTPNNPEHIAAPAPTFTFAGASELLPLNVAACVTLRTAKAGASYRGRVYLTGFGEGSSTAGNMSAAAQAGATEIVTAMSAALDDVGLTMSVGSRALGLSTAVTTILCRDSRWDTQRRRITPGI